MVAFGHATAGLTFCGQDIDPLHHTDILVVEGGRFTDDPPLEGDESSDLVLRIFSNNPAIVRIFLDSEVENEVENPHHLRGFGYGSPSEKIAP